MELEGPLLSWGNINVDLHSPSPHNNSITINLGDSTEMMGLNAALGFAEQLSLRIRNLINLTQGFDPERSED